MVELYSLIIFNRTEVVCKIALHYANWARCAKSEDTSVLVCKISSRFCRIVVLQIGSRVCVAILQTRRRVCKIVERLQSRISVSRFCKMDGTFRGFLQTSSLRADSAKRAPSLQTRPFRTQGLTYTCADGIAGIVTSRQRRGGAPARPPQLPTRWPPL